MKFFILVFLFFIAALSSAETEFFKVPDLAFVSPGTYHVFPKAPNRNGKFDTIYGAIEQALCDGYTPDAVPFQRASIIVMPGVYTGTGPDNEIDVPVSISINVHPTGTSGFVDGVKINATLVFTNAGLPPGSIDFLSSLAWTHSGFNLIQPSKDKPAIRFVNDFTAAFQILLFSESYISNSFLDSTAPMIEVSNGGIMFITDSFIVSSSSIAPIILAKDVSSVEAVYCNLIGYRIIASEGIGARVAGTFMAFFYTNFLVEPAFQGGDNDSEIKIIDIQSGGLDFVGMNHCYVGSLGTTGYTKGSTIFDASNLLAADCPPIFFQANSYAMEQIAGGTQLIYNAPTCSIDSGNKVRFGSISGVNVGTLNPSLDI